MSTLPKLTPRVYARACADQPQNYSNYEELTVRWSDPASYSLVQRIGKGKYSEVFEAVKTEGEKESTCVIKVLKPVKKKKIKREIQILQNLSGGPNIVKLLDAVKDPLTQYVNYL